MASGDVALENSLTRAKVRGPRPKGCDIENYNKGTGDVVGMMSMVTRTRTAQGKEGRSELTGRGDATV